MAGAICKMIRCAGQLVALLQNITTNRFRKLGEKERAEVISLLDSANELIEKAAAITLGDD